MNVALPSALKRFVEDQVGSGRYSDAGEVVRDSLRLMESRVGAFANNDIEARAFIVMSEATGSAQEDLRDVISSIASINTAKQEWRALLLKVSRDIAANDRVGQEDRPLDFSRGMATERAYHRCRVPRLDPDCPGGVCFDIVDLYPHRIAKACDLRLVGDVIKRNLDSMGEMSEMQSLRLQMCMDRFSKLTETLSNITKMISQTADAITANMM